MDKQYDIKESKERYNRYLRLEKMIEEKERQLGSQRMKLNDLYRALEKENQDVEALEKMSFSTLLTKITGQMKEKMEKEVQEVKIVELRFNDAKRIEKELLDELTKLKEEKQSLSGAKEAYKEALALKCENLDAQQTTKMEELQKEIGEAQGVIKESEEAIDAGEDAKEIVSKALRSLGSAQNWGFVDMIGALDFIADIAKYQKINEAKQLMNDLQYALRRFKTELVDVRFDSHFQMNISSFDTTIDFFFDNMFFDFMMQSKINEAKREVERTYSQIDGIIQELQSLHVASLQRIQDLREKIRQVIEES